MFTKDIDFEYNLYNYFEYKYEQGYKPDDILNDLYLLLETIYDEFVNDKNIEDD